ncbi:glycosyltransferase [Mariprofundus erugo]|uniref:Glycosyltransferase n=1 Tax=Mariprofundus erugo TaxID=2528639 RepID=A0A5R9GQ95_9PROT|nr:TIGR04283 family arsenosugar biosynthesis glycosyltransferase [Mariprofundus erugo]TLS66152.1 glycosyltransferase [Mariprofundus erugo]
MSIEPSIAVVVPLLNERTVLPALLEHLSTLGADELIIVDGGSTDGSCDFLAASGVCWITSAAGRSTQMNAGSALCTSDILLFIHADTVIDSGHIMAVRKAIAAPDIVGGRFDLHLSGSHPFFRIIERMINLRSRLSGISTGDQCMFVRRAVFEQLGGFAAIPLMEDIDLSRRLKRTGRIACLRTQVITSSRRWEQHGIFTTMVRMWWLRLLFWSGVPADRLAQMYRQAR